MYYISKNQNTTKKLFNINISSMINVFCIDFLIITKKYIKKINFICKAQISQNQHYKKNKHLILTENSMEHDKHVFYIKMFKNNKNVGKAKI